MPLGIIMGNEQFEDVTMTDEGREIAELVEFCYIEMSYEDGEYDTREECQAVAKSRGLEMVGAGVGRDIFAVDEAYHTGEMNCILKVPKNLVGAFECRREIQTWRGTKEIRPFLTPVLDHGMGWILMPKAEQELNTQEINDLLSELGETGWSCDDANEAHNLGKIDGEPVIIDYGMGCHHVEGHRAEGGEQEEVEGDKDESS